jgi:hypothetical protein
LTHEDLQKASSLCVRRDCRHKQLLSLGVHVLWDNATDKKYSRNLDPAHGKAIELICLPVGDKQ